MTPHRRVPSTWKSRESQRRFFRPQIERLEDRLLLAVFEVTNTLDAGDGSLRQALLDANATAEPDTIAFNLSATDPGHFYYQDDLHTGRVNANLESILPTATATDAALADADPDWPHSWWSIRPLTDLPDITSPVTIDGFTQAGSVTNSLAEGNDAVLRVELDGSGGAARGITIRADGSLVRGLVINRFTESGIQMLASGGTVAGNFIGAEVSGTTRHPGIQSQQGVFLGAGASGNTVGGITPEERNVISGNIVGMEIRGASATNNSVQGNFIGAAANGIRTIGNSHNGVLLSDGASFNTIGGTAAGARNIISANGQAGISISGNGTDAATGNVIQGNYIGLDVTGLARMGNAERGIKIFGNARGNLIGGTTAGARNVIADNGNSDFGGLGIELAGANTTENVVQGNYLGTNFTGLGLFQFNFNRFHGIRIGEQAHDNQIGGSSSGEGNLISGHGTAISISGGAQFNVVQGNLMGTDATGTAPLSNLGSAVILFGVGTDHNLIGGTVPGAGNVISGNGNPNFTSLTAGAISISGGAQFNVVQGNRVGTDATGTAPIPNTGSGVSVAGAGTDNNLIGGTAPGAGNLISGNNAGISISGGAKSNAVQGNRIGTDATGTAALPNAGSGVNIVGVGTSNNQIGGTVPGAGNVIAHNGLFGVRIKDANLGNHILGNSIFDNGILGIALVTGSLEGAPTPNDLGPPPDSDSGPNDLQNYPVLAASVPGDVDTTVIGALDSTPNTLFRLEFFANPSADQTGFGEGQFFLGARDVTTDGNGHVDFNFVLPVAIAAGQVISATATDSAGSTSEFSGAVVVEEEAPARFLDLISVPRQFYADLLHAAEPDVYAVELRAGDFLAIDVDPLTIPDPANLQLAPGVNSTSLEIVDPSGATLATIGASREPDTGTQTGNVAHGFRAEVSGTYRLRLTTSDSSPRGYLIELHRIALAEGAQDPEVLSRTGGMYASLVGDRMLIRGPTGYGFAIKGDWQQKLTTNRKTGRTTATYEASILRGPLLLETALGDFPVPFNKLKITTIATSRFADVFGQIKSIKEEDLGLPLVPIMEHLAEKTGLQVSFDSLGRSWQIELGSAVHKEKKIDQVLSAVPYFVFDNKMRLNLTWGKLQIETPNLVRRRVLIVADPTDPFLFVKSFKALKSPPVDKPTLAFSLHGRIPFVPEYAPSTPQEASLTHFFGHVFASGGIALPLIPEIKFLLHGDVTLDYDANRDGQLLGGVGDPSAFFRGELFTAAGLDNVLSDFNLGANGHLEADFGGATIIPLPNVRLGGGSVVYNGAQQGLWLHAVRGQGGENPWQGTPFAALNMSQDDFLEGSVFFRTGEFRLHVGSSYKLPAAKAEFSLTLTNLSFEAHVLGEAGFSVRVRDVGKVSAKATFEADLVMNFNSQFNRVHYVGTVTATGKVSRLFSGSIGARVEDGTVYFDFPLDIGELALGLP